MSAIDPQASAFRQAWKDVHSHLKTVTIGVFAVTAVTGAASGVFVPQADSPVGERVLTGTSNALIAIAVMAFLVFLISLLAAPVRQRNRARQLLSDRQDEIDRLQSPERVPLFSIRLPKEPRSGNIDNRKTAHFDQVLVTDLSGLGRNLRFSLSMPGRSFLDFGEFQSVYQEKHSVLQSYLSNPLDFKGNKQGGLAFIHGVDSEGVAEPWVLTVKDMLSGAILKITTLGEHECIHHKERIPLRSPGSEGF